MKGIQYNTRKRWEKKIRTTTIWDMTVAYKVRDTTEELRSLSRLNYFPCSSHPSQGKGLKVSPGLYVTVVNIFMDLQVFLLFAMAFILRDAASLGGMEPLINSTDQRSCTL